MKITLIAVFAALCAGALFAQAPAEKGKAVAEKKAAQAAVKPAEEPEESVVMIDSRTEPEDARTAAAYSEDRNVPGGLPSSYGQCRGVMNEGGRSVLVFESLEDGSIAFVQIVFGKTGVSWKLIDRIHRSAD